MAKRLNLEEIIKRFKKVHGDRYIYDEIKEYKNLKTKLDYEEVCISTHIS